ncbi:hypothetical protein [Saccharothrix xinjiangensis]|uniref:PPE family protein n=1 Tax=Saccharothrix xinjiangensis TaxID=204798 RepID=A0ABV9YEH5_9PSEU
MDQTTTRAAPTKPDTFYAGIPHSELYRALSEEASPKAVFAQGDLWKKLHQVMVDFSDAVAHAAAASEPEWEGRAGDGTRQKLYDLAREANTFGFAAKHAGEMSFRQAEALDNAQKKMPPPPVTPVSAESTTEQIIRAMSPLGLAQQAFMAFLESQRQKAEHLMAVDVVETYDRILAETCAAQPAFAPLPPPPPPPPPVDGHENFGTYHGRYPAEGSTQQATDDVTPTPPPLSGTTAAQGTTATTPGGATTAPSGLGQGLVPPGHASGHGGTTPQWSPPGGYTGGVGTGGYPGSARGISARLGGPGPHTGTGSRSGAAGAGRYSGAGAGAGGAGAGGAGGSGAGGPGAARNSSGVLGPHSEAARGAVPARPGGGATHAPPLGGAMAPAGATNDEDKDHQTAPYLLESDPESLFGNTDAVAPPVIGEW